MSSGKASQFITWHIHCTFLLFLLFLFSCVLSSLSAIPLHYFLAFLTRRWAKPDPKASSHTVLGQSAARETHGHCQTPLQGSSFFLQVGAQQLRHPEWVGVALLCEMRKFGYNYLGASLLELTRLQTENLRHISKVTRQWSNYCSSSSRCNQKPNYAFTLRPCDFCT